MTNELSSGQVNSTGMLCPVCRVNLVMTSREGVEIDYCPNCRGVWLDRGELDKIIERSFGVAQNASPQGTQSFAQPDPYAQPDNRYGGNYGSKHGGGHGHDRSHGHDRGHGDRGSFLRRLFD